MPDPIVIPVTRFWPRALALFWAAETALGLFFTGLGLAWIGQEEWLLTATLVLTGLFLALIGLMMFGVTWATVRVRGPVIEIGMAGLRDRRVSDETIPWESLRWGIFSTLRGGLSLQFHADGVGGIKWGSRLQGAFNRPFGYPPYTLMTLGTGMSLVEFAGMISEFRQPSY